MKSIQMKNSNIKWIGEIPSHWNVSRLKNVVCKKITDGPHETPLLIENGIPFISAEAVSSGKINFDKKRGYISLEDHKNFSKKYKPKKNDIFVIKSGSTTGTSALVDTDIEFNIWSPLAVIRSNVNVVIPKYTFYFISSPAFRQMIEFNWSYGTQQNIGMGVIEKIFIPIPSKNEQEKIANYLDIETSKIDRKISTLEQKVDKLEEYKQSVIFETVTNGLDSNVAMKNSDIDWIGDIPEHWEVKRVKEFYKLGMGQTILKEDLIENGQFPIYSATAEDKFFGYVNKINNPLNIGDLVIPARGNSIGHVKLVKQTVSCTQTTIYMKKKGKINSNYVYYYLIGNKPQLFFFDDTAIPQITVEQINGKLMLIPPLDEEKKISDYLDNFTFKLEKQKAIIKKQIALLQEYKQSVIFEAVTGKLKIQ